MRAREGECDNVRLNEQGVTDIAEGQRSYIDCMRDAFEVLSFNAYWLLPVRLKLKCHYSILCHGY